MERIFKFINQALYFVSMVLLLLEVVIVAGVAFCRYILHYTPAGRIAGTIVRCLVLFPGSGLCNPQ